MELGRPLVDVERGREMLRRLTVRMDFSAQKEKTVRRRWPSSWLPAGPISWPSTWAWPEVDGWTVFAAILGTFAIFMAASLPDLMALDTWVFKDASSLLNVDELLDQKLRPGVDFYYSEGLLPLLLQRVLFQLFGRGFWPLIGVGILHAVLAAVAWTLLIRPLENRLPALLAVVVLCPILLPVDPSLPVCLTSLSILFALVLVTGGQKELALAVVSVGCMSMPLLPLVLAALLVVFIAAEWWAEGERALVTLVLRLLPGVVAFAGLVSILTVVFGIPSMLAMVSPVNWAGPAGNPLAAALGGMPSRPPGFSLFGLELPGPAAIGSDLAGTLLLGPPAWFVFGALTLLVLGIIALVVMIRRGASPGAAVAVMCGAMLAAGAFAAFRFPSWYLPSWDIPSDIPLAPLLAAGIIIGVATLPVGWARVPILVLFVLLGIPGEVQQLSVTAAEWRDDQKVAKLEPLLARPAWTEEWSRVLTLASSHKLLLLSPATGVHHYFPEIRSPEMWSPRAGSMLPSDRKRLMTQMAAADVVVTDLAGLTGFVDRDAPVQKLLATMCLTETLPDFRVWMRSPPAGTRCHTGRPNE